MLLNFKDCLAFMGLKPKVVSLCIHIEGAKPPFAAYVSSDGPGLLASVIISLPVMSAARSTTARS
ncbi:MAG: hypothetical protein WB554_06945 [Desulfomonilaceae bacterium]